MNKIFTYLKQIYRLALSYKKHEEIVWKDLKKLHKDLDWKFGVFEKDRYIEAVFEVAEEVPLLILLYSK